jgi:flagellum-specific peptidoglycan hydrolase FlgJ
MHQKYIQIFHNKINDQVDHLKLKIKKAAENFRKIFQTYWFRAVMLSIVIWMFYIKDVSINLNLKANPNSNYALQRSEITTISSDDIVVPQNTSLLNAKDNKALKTSISNNKAKGKDDNLMNTYSNLPFDGSTKKLSESDKKRAAKKRKQLAYVKKYEQKAKHEMKAHGIPASITLAQGLLESNAGESRLAKNNNNHFGMKCFSRKCKKGHCSNFTDDSHKDFFKIYKDPAESYKAHSSLLTNGARYNSLFKLKKSDYKGWARGLRKAGYATDPIYDKKLIRLIENLKLYKYDK